MGIIEFIKRMVQGTLRDVVIIDVAESNDFYYAIGIANFYSSFIIKLTKTFDIVNFTTLESDVMVSHIASYGDKLVVSGTKYKGSMIIPIVIMISADIERINQIMVDPEDVLHIGMEEIYIEDIVSSNGFIYIACRISTDHQKSFIIRMDENLSVPYQFSSIIDMGQIVDYVSIKDGSSEIPRLTGWVLEKPENGEFIYPIPRKVFEIKLESVFNSTA